MYVAIVKISDINEVDVIDEKKIMMDAISINFNAIKRMAMK
jgi:hypothetical protein